MNIKPFNTGDVRKRSLNVLIYGHAGSGKTHALGDFKDIFGKGLVISGEAGLETIMPKNIDAVEFYSVIKPVDKNKYPNGYSFKEILEWIQTPQFREIGYNWIAVDSLTELSRRAFAEARESVKDNRQVYTQYDAILDPIVNDLRDLPIHTILVALAVVREADGQTVYWPMLNQKSKEQQYCGTADLVGCITVAPVTAKNSQGKEITQLQRFTIYDKVQGWQGKRRDPKNRIASIENDGNVAEKVKRILMTDEEYEKYKTQGATQ